MEIEIKDGQQAELKRLVKICPELYDVLNDLNIAAKTEKITASLLAQDGHIFIDIGIKDDER